MAWGQRFEIYVAEKENDNMGETFAYLTVGGDDKSGKEKGWTAKEVRDFAKKLNAFNEEVQKLIKETDGEGLCVRTNY